MDMAEEYFRRKSAVGYNRTSGAKEPNLQRLMRRIRLATGVLFGARPESVRFGSTLPHFRDEIPAITPEEVAEARSFFPMEKFFIFGHARSGTTLLTRLVRTHPEVHCNYQAHFFTRPPLLQSLVTHPEVGAWLSRRSNRWNRGRDLSPVVLRAVSDFIMERDARREGKWVVGDKSPNSLLDGEAVRLMVRVYPDARLVFIVRDGRDAAISHRFQAFIDNPQSLSKEDLRIRQGFAQQPEPYLSGQRSLFTAKGIRQAAEGWVHNVTETDQAARDLLPGLYHTLRYEDLLQHPQEEMSRLWFFLGVDPAAAGATDALAAELAQNPDADWQLQKASDIAAAIQKGKSGSWRNIFTSRDKQVFNKIARATLQAWGYE
jgi:hypothetical protein